MKIGILTQPLHSNYGGLLQCFALQTILKRLGHEAYVIRRIYGVSMLTPKERFFYYLQRLLGKIFGRTKKTFYFVSKYINPKTELVPSTQSLQYCHKKEKFNAYVVGSDQVWRPCYSPCITNYFLDFISSQEKVKRVAYAASFGVDEWEFSEDESKVCRELAQCFDAISVREDSAVALCEKHLNRNDAVHVLDPTMLLEKDDYMQLITQEQEKTIPGNVFCYILNESTNKTQIIKLIVDQINGKPFTKMPCCDMNIMHILMYPNRYIYPSVTSWLRSYVDAEMVITDSFHGCVFSIIFNKPFWVIGNTSRGMARFYSLLKTFGLESRLISIEKLPSDFRTPIDWRRVNEKRQNLQKKSMLFLVEALK